MAATFTPNPADRQPDRATTDGHRPALLLIQGGRSSTRMAVVYRRRRLVATLVALLLVGASVGMIRVGLAAVTPSAPAPPGGSSATPAAPRATVVVEPGDSLWSVARRIQPSGDVRALVDRLAAAHGPGPLQPGETLSIRT